MNLNNVSRLFNAGMRPVWCSSINKKWKRVSKTPLYEKVDNELQVTFEVIIPPHLGDITYYFAYCIPYTYSDLQHRLLALKTDYLKYISNKNNNGIITSCRRINRESNNIKNT